MLRKLFIAMTAELGTRYIMAAAFLFGCFFWLADALLDYTFFYGGQGSFLDALALNVTPDELFDRLAFMTACLVGGFLLATLLKKQRESEVNYRALFETMTQGVIYQNEQGIFSMNQSAEEILGASCKELAGRPCSHSGLKNIHEDGSVFLPEEHPAMVALREGKRVIDVVMGIFNQRENQYRWILINAVPQFRKGNPTPYQVYSTFKDITDRIRTEQALRESERRYRNLYEKTPVMLHSLNREGRLVTVNDHWLETFGYTREEVIWRKWTDFLTEESARYAREVTIPNFFATGRSFNLSYQVVKKSGEVIDVLLSGIAERDGDGHIVRSIAVIIDVTEQKRAETEIRRLNEELERRVFERTAQFEAANKELEAFAYSVSHDLRAPLRAIDGFSHALLEDYHDRVDDRGKDYLQRVRGASQRMGQLIDDLLKLSRVTRGEMRLERTDLSGLVGDVVEKLRESDPHRQAEFLIQPDLTVMADPRLLRVALENLLGNAWKFTSRQEKARIEFGTAQPAGGDGAGNDGGAAYFVKDDGAGFDMAYADKLFGAFQRLHGAREFSGTGIGLATVQRIIHRHGGRVWAEGAVGHGATFYFTL